MMEEERWSVAEERLCRVRQEARVAHWWEGDGGEVRGREEEGRLGGRGMLEEKKLRVDGRKNGSTGLQKTTTDNIPQGQPVGPPPPW
jgi:hypothetical protein